MRYLSIECAFLMFTKDRKIGTTLVHFSLLNFPSQEVKYFSFRVLGEVAVFSLFCLSFEILLLRNLRHVEEV